MKQNYQAWSVDISDFPRDASLREQLKFLLCFAILAPSGHNSQPWKFSIEGNAILILVDRERALSESDPGRRQLLISIGCAIENLVIAADYYGLKADIAYFPDRQNEDLVARVSFQKIKVEKNDKEHLIFTIPQRCTNRSRYKGELPPGDFLESIKGFSDHEFLVSVVTGRAKKDALADIAVAAQIEAMDSLSFRKELSHYIKSNFTKSGIGMPGFTLGMPAPISLFASRLIKRVNMSRKTKKQDATLLKQYTPAFVVISTKQDDKISCTKAGQLFERIWLMAEKGGLSCAPLAAAVQTKDYYRSLQGILSTSCRPQIFFRIGYATKKVRHSPRLDVSDVLQ